MTHKLWASEWQANYQRYYPWLWTYDGTNIYQTPSFFHSASISNIVAWFDEFEPSHSKLEFSADSEPIAIRIVPGTKLMTIGFARPVSQNSRNFMIFDLRKGRCIYRVCLLFCCSQNFFSCRYGGSEQFLKEKNSSQNRHIWSSLQRETFTFKPWNQLTISQKEMNLRTKKRKSPATWWSDFRFWRICIEMCKLAILNN